MNYLMLKNILIGILFFMLIDTCFELNLNNVQISIISFCLGYYLSKRRPSQVYIEINNCIFRLKKIDALTASLEALEIAEDSLPGKDLSAEKSFYKIQNKLLMN